MFEKAQHYERFMGRHSRLLAQRFAEFAGVAGAHRVLDVGCGTGALTAAIVAVAPAAEIVGIDPSPGFVEHASSQVHQARFSVGDAQALPFADASFDAACACLVFNFIPDQKAALAEMRRVVRPGGTVAAALWDHVHGMLMLKTFWDAVDALDPVPPSVQEPNPLLDRADLERLWQEADLRDIATEPLVIETRFASFDDYWRPFALGQGPAGAYVAQAPAAMLDRIAQELRRRLHITDPDAPFALTARAWAIRGTRP